MLNIRVGGRNAVPPPPLPACMSAGIKYGPRRRTSSGKFIVYVIVCCFSYWICVVYLYDNVLYLFHMIFMLSRLHIFIFPYYHFCILSCFPCFSCFHISMLFMIQCCFSQFQCCVCLHIVLLGPVCVCSLRRAVRVTCHRDRDLVHVTSVYMLRWQLRWHLL